MGTNVWQFSRLPQSPSFCRHRHACRKDTDSGGITNYGQANHQQRQDDCRQHRDVTCRTLSYPPPIGRGRNGFGLADGRSAIEEQMKVAITSFSYKRGLPEDKSCNGMDSRGRRLAVQTSPRNGIIHGMDGTRQLPHHALMD